MMSSRDQDLGISFEGTQSAHCSLGSPGHTTGSCGWTMVGTQPGSEPEFMVPLYGLCERFPLSPWPGPKKAKDRHIL